VRPEERSLALGIQSIIIRLVGSIPGPVLFGFVVDKVCLLWEPGCGEFSPFAGTMMALKER
jgi:organic anion transporter 4A